MNQIAIDFDAPRARRSDPETSHEAAAKAALGASEGRLAALRSLAGGPKTDFELAAATGRQQTSIGKRRGECMAAGFVAPMLELGTAQKVRRPSPSGSPAIVWQITEAGRRFLAGLE